MRVVDIEQSQSHRLPACINTFNNHIDGGRGEERGKEQQQQQPNENVTMMLENCSP